MAGRGNVQVKIETQYDGSGINRAEQGVSRFGSTAQKHAKEAVTANTILTGSFKSMARQAVTAGASFAAAYIGISKAKNAIETTESLAKTTQILTRNFGLSTRAASTWASVMKANNVDAASLQLSFTALSKAIGHAKDGQKSAVQAFTDLGVSQSDLKKQNFQETLNQVVDGLTKMRGGAQRAADAQTLLGRGAKTLAPLFRGDGLGFQQQAKWAEKYGATLDGHAIKSSKELAIASEQLKFAQLGLQIQFTEKVAPALLTVERAASKVIAIFNDPKLTPTEKVQQIEHLFEQLGNKAEHVFEQVAPKLMDEAAKLAPKSASAFVTAWWHAGIWGKLFTIALLSKKLGLFSTVGQLAANQWGGSFKKRVATQAEQAAVMAAGEQGLLSAGVLSKFRAAGLVLGGITAASIIAKLTGIKNADPLAFLNPQNAGDPRPGHGDVQKRSNKLSYIDPNTGKLQFTTPSGGQPPTHHPHGRPRAHGGSVAHAGSTGFSSTSARSAGTTYSHAQLKGLAMSVGLNSGAAEIAAAVAQAESGGRSDATNHNTDGSVDAGLWQINSVHGYPLQSLFNPGFNAKAMAAVSSGGTNWMPWTTYKNGAYKRYLTGGTAAPVSARGGISGLPPGLAQALRGVTNFPIAPRFPAGLRNQIAGNVRIVNRSSQTFSDLDRLVSQQERMGNFGAATWLLKAKEFDQKADLKAARAALKGYKRELKILRHQLRTTPRQRQSRIIARIKAIQGRIKDLQQTAHDLGFDITDTQLDIKDEQDQAAQAADTSSGADTSGTAADNSAQLQDLTNAINALRDQISGVQGVTTVQAVKALADVISGQITGFGYSPRASTAGAGSVARY